MGGYGLYTPINREQRDLEMVMACQKQKGPFPQAMASHVGWLDHSGFESPGAFSCACGQLQGR